MALSTATTDLMKHLPAALRPNPWNIDDTVMQAAENGWTTRDLVAATLADRPKEAGHVVVALRRLASEPAPRNPNQTTGTGPCLNNCDHGWHESVSQPGKVVPCSSCRPDTHRRVTEREEARQRGAGLDAMHQIMSNTRDTERTYWTAHAQ